MTPSSNFRVNNWKIEDLIGRKSDSLVPENRSRVGFSGRYFCDTESIKRRPTKIREIINLLFLEEFLTNHTEKERISSNFR
jgi:hypothetical protein